jgi:hypothetical protein
MRSRHLVISAILAGAVGGGVSGVAAAPDPTSAHPATVAAAVAVATAPVQAPALVARYGFDGDRSGPTADESGNGHTLRLIAGNGGTVHVVPHRSGQALRFPAKCTGAGTCRHAALQSPSAANLNPGTRPLSFGAMVLLARSQTTPGQNVVQKGYSTTGSQYKLQIDGGAGRASCVLVGARSGIKIVHSSISVADGSWHTIECRRAGTSLTVLVDGAVRGHRAISARLSVSNNRPLSLGGKGGYADNDQFHGILDDVWVRIG